MPSRTIVDQSRPQVATLRVLIVSSAPLEAESGAAQVALNLSAALSERGHEAVAWSPSVIARTWWNPWRDTRRAISQFVINHGPFDVVDTQALTASATLRRAGVLVVRSIQPELRYLLENLRAAVPRGPSAVPRTLFHAFLAVGQATAIVRGWHHASTILSLGRSEAAWMARRFPRWRDKIDSYVNAPSAAEQAVFASIRRGRSPNSNANGVRFLWLGRWTAHKGVRQLLDFIAVREQQCPADTVTIAGCGVAAEREVPVRWLESGRVQLVPRFSRQELPALLGRHHAGLFTSTVEGWGLSLNEMLESGMPVFATSAGGVADLQPFFPSSLRPFPPPSTVEFGSLEDLNVNGYYSRFSWPAIAADYERVVLSNLVQAHATT